MNWAWATSLEHVWRSPAFPMWLTLAAAGFFGIIVLITLLRAEKSVANGALTVITLLAVGIALAATIRGYGPGSRGTVGEIKPSPVASAAMPALSCIDDIAGDAILLACEKALFGSAESVAAAVSYAAAQINRLTALGDMATANRAMTPDVQALRRTIERDRYGLMAQVLQARDGCTPAACVAFRSLTDNHQIAANMDERTYDNIVARHVLAWNAQPLPSQAPIAALGPSLPTGKPTNAEFPSAASTPPVSIMTPEPPLAQRPAPAAANASVAAPHPSPSVAQAKKPPQPKRTSAVSAPVPISPPAPAPAPSDN